MTKSKKNLYFAMQQFDAFQFSRWNSIPRHGVKVGYCLASRTQILTVTLIVLSTLWCYRHSSHWASTVVAWRARQSAKYVTPLPFRILPTIPHFPFRITQFRILPMTVNTHGVDRSLYSFVMISMPPCLATATKHVWYPKSKPTTDILAKANVSNSN